MMVRCDLRGDSAPARGESQTSASDHARNTGVGGRGPHGFLPQHLLGAPATGPQLGGPSSPLQRGDIAVPLNARALQFIRRFGRATDNPCAHTGFARYGRRIAGVGESAGLSTRFRASRATSYARGMT